MKIFKLFLCLVISIILICSAAVLQVSLSLKKDILSNKFYLEKISDSKISDKLEKSMYNKFYDYASKNKLPTNATSDIISPLWIEAQFTTVTNGIISYSAEKTDILPTIDSKTPQEKFDISLKKSLVEKNQPFDNVAKASELEFFKSFNDIPFTEAFNKLHEDNLKNTLNYCRKYIKVLNFAPYVSALVLLTCVLMFFLTTPRLMSWKLWTGYALIIGGLIPSVTSFVIANSSIVDTYLTNTITIPTDSIFPPRATIILLRDTINSVLMGLTKYGAVFVFSGIAIILIVTIFDGKKANVFWYKHKSLK